MNGIEHRIHSNQDVWYNASRHYVKPELETGRVYDTVINGKEVGKTLYFLFGKNGRFQRSVSFVEKKMITLCGFDYYELNDGKLILENVSWPRLDDDELIGIIRNLKRKGLLENA